MKGLLRILLAVVLTVPVFLGVTRIDILVSWLFSESGYQALSPLFRLFGTVGVEGHENVIAGVLLVLSVVIAVGLVCVGSTLLKRLRARDLQPRQ